MRHGSISSFIAEHAAALARGPVALLLAEDRDGLAASSAHLRKTGFGTIICLLPQTLEAPPEAAADGVHFVTHDLFRPDALTDAVNRFIDAAPGVWFHYCYSGEFLFFPFSETRRIGEMLNFHAEERRDAMLTYVVDLYATDLRQHPDGVDMAHAHFDRAGYFAQTRRDDSGNICERQLDFFGGLRWRFEEHVAADRRRIDRIGLFRAVPGLRLLPDHRFNMAEYNTYTSPWHHSLTAAICSFRAARALACNPGSREHIDTFMWHYSEPFQWNARQLLELGLIEPGQWF